MAQKKETKPVKAPAKTVVKKAPAAKAAPSKTASKGKAAKEVGFKAYSPASGSVAIAGDFSGWKPVALKKDKNGSWSGKIKLATGVYQYKLVFDGQYWETDNANPERISDGHGGENSIVRV
jgi:1,4-alpha-glucan branching enzyme